MILTVTLNPMLDKTVSVGRTCAGGRHACSGVSMIVGEKGQCVTAAAPRLERRRLATGLSGAKLARS